jgi:hypothetical protein
VKELLLTHPERGFPHDIRDLVLRGGGGLAIDRLRNLFPHER